MRKFQFTVGVLAALLLLTGCISTIYTKTIAPDGTVTEVTENVQPLLNKGFSSTAKAVGIEATMFDPTTGAYSPCVKVLYGKGEISSLPLTTGKAVEAEFAVYEEVLYYDKSMWGAEIATMEYRRRMGGAMKDQEPSVTINVDADGKITVAAPEPPEMPAAVK